MKALQRAAGVGLGLALLAGCVAAGPVSHRVVIEGMRFSPETLVVRPGDRIVWENRDLVPHTATAADGRAFDSRTIAPGATWTQGVRTEGEVPYVCTLHPTMKARLVARPR